MEIKHYKEEEYTIIQITGDLDASSAVILDDAIKEVMHKNEKNIFIDCQNLNYIASAGLGVFMSYISDITANSINFRLFNMSNKILDVFKVLGLNVLLNIDSTKKEVISSIK